MQLELKLRIRDDHGIEVAADTVLLVEKDADHLESIGLSLAEAKQLLEATQERVVVAQARDYCARHRACPSCGQRRSSKGYAAVQFRTLFGTVRIPSQRLHRCSCETGGAQSFSPLSGLLVEHAAPELSYIETKWASHVSYSMTAALLKDVLPVSSLTNASTIRNDLHRTAEKMDEELGEERHGFIDGCPAEWYHLPVPEGPVVVGLDGGYVRSWEDRKTHFEILAGKSVPEDRDDRYFGMVATHDAKPKRRLYEVLQSQGVQPNQAITFMTDGADTLRSLTSQLSPCAEHVLDWFHLTMRFTVLGQFAKGLSNHDSEAGQNAEDRLRRIKWRLWNGDAAEALIRLGDLTEDLQCCEADYDGLRKFVRLIEELTTYVANNVDSIPHYGERYRNGERISTGFVESAVNVVVDKRMSKRQQMQWTKQGAHRVLQTRAATLNSTLRQTFVEWYPRLAVNDDNLASCAAA